MISELISFADRHLGETVSRREFKEPIIVIRTMEDAGSLKFSGSDMLESEEAAIGFLKTVPDLASGFGWNNQNDFKSWIRKQKNLRSGNKCLGSTQGLMNAVPYVFQLSEKNLDSFEEKAGKMESPKSGWKSNPELQGKITEDLRSIYLNDFWEKQAIPKEKLNGALVFALFPEKIHGIERKALYSAFSSDRSNEWENPEFCSKDKMPCPICQKEAILGTPREVTYQGKKPFMRHSGRPDEGGIGFRMCLSCENSYAGAKENIFSAGFRIFPIFQPVDVPEELLFYDAELGRAKSFRKIFEEMKGRAKSGDGKYKFHLVALAGKNGEVKIRLYDYISGYSPFFKDTNYTRFGAELDLWSLILPGKTDSEDEKSGYPYFEDTLSMKRLTPRTKQLLRSLREKIFNFTYRGDDFAITKNDIADLLDAKVADSIISISNPVPVCKTAVEKTLKLISLGILRWKNMEVPKEDQEKAKHLGRAVRMIIEFSEAGNKHTLLGYVIDKPLIEGQNGVKGALARLLDKYRHKFNELNPSDQKLISDSLKDVYSANRFEPLKTYFYAGYFEVSE